MKKIISVLTLVAIVFIGCSKKENPVEPGTNNQGTNPSGQPIPTFAGSNNGVLATISYQQTVSGFNVDLAVAFAKFGENGVDAGNVSVNGTAIGKMVNAGNTYYIAPSQTNPVFTLDFNGATHNWNVQGGNGVTGFTGSVTSPRAFTVTAPVNNATVSKSSGFNVTWSGGTSSKVMIVLAAQSGGGYFTSSELSDNGSYNINASNLGNFNGPALLQVVKYNYTSKESGGKNYILVSEIVRSINLTVN
jgi:hypothetical protein